MKILGLTNDDIFVIQSLSDPCNCPILALSLFFLSIFLYFFAQITLVICVAIAAR